MFKDKVKARFEELYPIGELSQRTIGTHWVWNIELDNGETIAAMVDVDDDGNIIAIERYDLPECPRQCSVCMPFEGDPDLDHHWMYTADEENPVGCMVCKHCEAKRPVAEADEF